MEKKAGKQHRSTFHVLAESIQASWGARPFVLDSQLLGDSFEATRFLGSKVADGLAGTTVLSVDAIEAATTAQLSNSFALRLRPHRPNELARLEAALRTRPLDTTAIPLVVDFGLTAQCPDGPGWNSLAAFLRTWQWKMVTLLSGAFPKDLTGLTVGQHLIPRSDWLAWCEFGRRLPQSPNFGDYTIQHPIFSEPPARANFSASIRYTTTRDWLVMRGEGVLNDEGPGYAQWPANAQLLLERAEFCGADFSYGDRYISEMAGQSIKPGNAGTWLRAGINHHISFAVSQLSELPST